MCEDEELTYRELDERSNQLAHYLQKWCNMRIISWDLRYTFIRDDCRSLRNYEGGRSICPNRSSVSGKSTAVHFRRCSNKGTGDTGKVTTKMVIPTFVNVICIDRNRAEIEQEVTTVCTSEVTGDNLAYIIYTSGSTGNQRE